MRRLVLASALLATLLFGSLASAVPLAAASPDFVRGDAALRFVSGAQRADGSIDGSISETADYVIGAADFGYDPSLLAACSGETALGFIATASDKSQTDAAKTAKAALAVSAAGLDPVAFDGRNLVDRLAVLLHPATGGYGDGSTFAQSLSILALHAAGREVPVEAVAYLAKLQDSDGSWNFKSAANATAGDTNSTSIALIALAAAGNHSTEAKALAWLHTQQLADGGFPYQNSTVFGPPASDPDSDSLVIQALLATGKDPTAPEWSKGSANAMTHLRSRQAASGGFTFPGSSAPDAFTTSMVFPALAGLPYGSRTSVTAGKVAPRAACPAPTATAKATPPPTSAGAALGGGAETGWAVGATFGLSGLALLAIRRKRRTGMR